MPTVSDTFLQNPAMSAGYFIDSDRGKIFVTCKEEDAAQEVTIATKQHCHLYSNNTGNSEEDSCIDGGLQFEVGALILGVQAF